MSKVINTSIVLSEVDTPLRSGEVVSNVEDIYDIQTPRVGMRVFVRNTGEEYLITSLKPGIKNGVEIPYYRVKKFVRGDVASVYEKPLYIETTKNDKKIGITIGLSKEQASTIEFNPATEEQAGIMSAEDKVNLENSKVIQVTWGNDLNIDNFVTAGVYNIRGERVNDKDGLPINNAASGHTINATLEVYDSSISDTTNDDDKCITQKLTLSNRVAGDGNVYIRTGRGRTYDSISWEDWATLQTNINVGRVKTLDNLIDNGIYSGVWTDDSSFVETFVMVVLNDYAVAGGNRAVTQFKYAYNTLEDLYVPASFKTRKLTQASSVEWTAWKDINEDNIKNLINTEIAKLTDIDEDLIQRIQALVDWIQEHGGEVEAIYNAIESNTKKIDEEIKRSGNVDRDLLGKIDTEMRRATEAEEELVEKIDKEVEAIKDGDTIVGQAREVYSRTGKTVPDSFLVRTTAGSGTVGDGVASLKKIGGNIVKNLLSTQSTIEKTEAAAYTLTDGFLTINAFGTSVYGGTVQRIPYISGHKVYVSVNAYNNDGHNTRLINSSTYADGRVQNTWVRLSLVASAKDGLVYLRVLTPNKDVATGIFSNLITIDLTEMFGAGNEPNKDTCDRLFGTMDALPQGLSIAKPTEFKSVGYNQFNPENVLKGKTIDENGAIIDSTTTDIAVIPCLPCKVGTGENNGYCIHGDFELGAEKVYLTPLNPKDVEGELYMHELTKDATTNTYVPQIKGYMLVEVPTTANLCCHFLWSEDRDKHDYEPYHESKVELPVIPQMSEWGLAGISSSGTLVADEIDFERGVYRKKIGAVDLGTLNWGIEVKTREDGSQISAFISGNLRGLVNSSGFYEVTNIYTKLYTAAPNYSLNSARRELGHKEMMYYNNTTLYIRDDSYADKTAFKQAMQGVMLYYELATPEEYPLPKFDNNYISSDYGVEQFNSTIPCNANNLYYMRSLVGETRNFLDRMYDNTTKTDAKEVADYITNGIEDNKVLATNAPNLALRALFVAAGAEYNDTDSVKEISVEQDADLGGTKVQHLPNCYRLNSLGDITEDEMIKIYNLGRFTKTEYSPLAYLVNVRTNLGRRGQANAASGETFQMAYAATGLVTINLCSEGVYEGTFLTSSNAFYGCGKLRAIYGRLILNTSSKSIFQGCSALERVKINSLDKNVLLGDSPLISKRSVLYMIQKANPTTAITITLHADAYARLAEDADIVAALEEKNASLSGTGGSISLVSA